MLLRRLKRAEEGGGARIRLRNDRRCPLCPRERRVPVVTARRDLFASMRSAQSGYVRSRALVEAAVLSIAEGAGEAGNVEFLHRLAKMDTEHGLESLRHVAAQHVPYAVLLYERYLGRPFASHRDSVSERVGNVMEDAIEDILATANISFRKTGRAERIPGFEQAPDFFIPDEVSPRVLIEAKITGDDGTARDKVARILRLASMRDERVRAGRQGFELVVCIDGRGFGTRRQDMRDMLTATQGKVFTLNTLDRLVAHTGISAFRA